MGRSGPWRTGCIEENCEGRHYGRGFCEYHWTKHYRAGTLDLVALVPPLVCACEGCSEDVKSRGYCSRHYRRFLAYGKA